MSKKTKEQNSRGKFLTSGACVFLIVVFAFLFAFGLLCSIWHAVTISDVSEGNVFGYSAMEVDTDIVSPAYVTGDKIVVHAIPAEEIQQGDYIVYNTGNDEIKTYSLGQVIRVDVDNYRVYVTDNTCNASETKSVNTALYIGIVGQESEFMYNLIAVLNSAIMVWLFAVVFGLIFVILLALYIIAIKHRDE